MVIEGPGIKIVAPERSNENLFVAQRFLPAADFSASDCKLWEPDATVVNVFLFQMVTTMVIEGACGVSPIHVITCKNSAAQSLHPKGPVRICSWHKDFRP